MKITPFAGLLFLSFLSCKLKMTSTAVFPPMVTPAQIDTVILLRPTDQFNPPDHIYLTCKMKITNCYYAETYDSLLTCIQKLARQKGGNVAEIEEAGKYVTTVNVYSLAPPQLNHYKKVLDSLRQEYEQSIKNIAVVYIVDQDEYKGKVYFNDSLVTSLKGVGYDGLRDPRKTTLTFDRPGVLNIIDAGKIDIQLGREYYIMLYDALEHRQFVHHYRLIDRDRFVINAIQFF